MVDLDEMMNKINNINARVEELYSKTFEYCEKDVLVTEEAVNSDYYLKSCIAQQAKEIRALIKERDNLAASLETEKAHAKTCNDNFYEYRLSSNGTIKGYQQELEKVRGERETLKALNEQLRADFDVLAKNHKALGEQYDDLRRQLCDELKDRDAEIKSLKETISNLKTDIKYSKTRYIDKTIAFNRLNGEHLDLKREYDNLAKAADKYSWKRVDRSEPLPLKDHDLYLFAVDGYPTPVKGRYHDDSLSNISIIVDDGDGKGPVYKVLFFMDGHIRYWTPLPEMPDMPEGENDYD